MATLTDNTVYLSIDGTNMSSYFIAVEITPSVGTVETTTGSASDYTTRNDTLNDYSLTLTVAYDDTNYATILPLVAPGAHTIILGMQGSAAGKPKHEQSFIFTQAPTSVKVEKNERRAFQVTAQQAAAPTSNMFAGATF